MYYFPSAIGTINNIQVIDFRIILYFFAKKYIVKFKPVNLASSVIEIFIYFRLLLKIKNKLIRKVDRNPPITNPLIGPSLSLSNGNMGLSMI